MSQPREGHLAIRNLSSSLGILAKISSSNGCIKDSYKLEKYVAQEKVIESISSIEKKSLPRSLALSAGGCKP